MALDPRATEIPGAERFGAERFGPGAGAPPTRGVVRHFVRMKLRIVGNGLRRSSAWRIVMFITGILGGLWAIAVGFAAFAAIGFAPAGARAALAAFAGAGVVLAWTLLPLLFFGVDETLDPARFALLPIPRRTLVLGMLAAACVGIPPVVTLVSTLGSVVGAAVKGGPAAALVAVLGALVGLALCVVASRAMTSAFAGMLRSRRVRDLAALIIALLGISCGPLQNLIFVLIADGGTSRVRTVAGVLSWTPLAAPYVAYLDAIDGRWALVPARLVIGLAGVALLLWWWSRTLESAMVGSSTGGATKAGRTSTAGPVAAFFSGVLRALPANRFGGLLAREIRYWWRDPRRRAGLISLLAASVVVPLAFTLSSRSAGGGELPLPVPVTFAGLFLGLMLANQFGNDGSAYALHLLVGVPGRAELVARALGVAVLTLPPLALGAAAAAVVGGSLAQLPAALGAGLAAFGVSVGVAGLTSVLAPHAMPDSTNPFALNSGSATAKGLLSLVSMLISAVLAAPPLVMYLLLPGAYRWLLLPVGALWGLVGGWIGSYAAGAVLDRRAPEVLYAVTPRR